MIFSPFAMLPVVCLPPLRRSGERVVNGQSGNITVDSLTGRLRADDADDDDD
jgi:hypothetical protein